MHHLGTAGILLAAACEEPLPDAVWSGELVTVRSSASDAELEEVCEGTFRRLDEYARFLDDEFSIESPKSRVDYLWFPGEDGPRSSCEGSPACARGRVVYTSDAFDRHELTHAIRNGILHGPRVFEEGIAVVYGGHVEEDNLGTVELLLSHLGGGDFPSGGYPTAGHFVSFLIPEFGLESFNAVTTRLGVASGQAAVEDVWLDVTGEPFSAAIDAYADYPACAPTLFANNSFDCGEEPSFIWGDAPGQITLTAACGDGATVGTATGRRQRSFTFENTAHRLVSNVFVDNHGDAAVDVRVRLCGMSCWEATPFDEFANFSDLTIGPGSSSHGMFSAVPGRFVVTVESASDSRIDFRVE